MPKKFIVHYIIFLIPIFDIIQNLNIFLHDKYKTEIIFTYKMRKDISRKFINYLISK